MDNSGWIKLHRKLLDNPITSKPNWLWLWIYLLLKANHEPNSIIWNGKPMVIERGQLLTGFHTLKKETRLTLQVTRSALEYLKTTHQITIKTTNKWSLITINNYDTYQEITHKITNQQQTNNKQITTNKNNKNDKNEKKNTYMPFFKKFISDFNQLTGKHYKETAGVQAKYMTRLNTFTPEDIDQAMYSLVASPYHIGQNDSKTFYATPEFLLRSDEQVDKWLNAKKTVKNAPTDKTEKELEDIFFNN
jgi:hypothetical protein